ncbi:MAG: exodeoxyribonuclease VII large subunit, partial [Gammaproteobacteria bacterium]|nr:exodeoxyribonuclease VII large subunit [Gammaproteobacteria bacterium]
PVVTGIGHEIDFTIADFVADHRAPTPSAAAELISPNQHEWLDLLQRHAGRLQLHLRQRMDRKRQDLLWLTKRLEQLHPGQRLRQQAQRLDELEQRLKNAQRAGLRHAVARLAEIHAHLLRCSPAPRLSQWRAQTDYLAQRLHNALHRGQERYRERLASLSRALDTVSPLATLGRGYAIVTRLPDRNLLRDAADVTPGERVEARLARGRLLCRVDEVKKK